MTTAKKLGIWMDNSSAHLLTFTSSLIKTKVIESSNSDKENEQGTSKNENNMHNKEQHQQSDYYKRISDEILHYDEVIIFGPTNAKSELVNILKADHRFAAIKLEVKQSDKMTENQEHAFVKEYFSIQRFAL
jgi:stalled ribosome rescue protein Dom34